MAKALIEITHSEQATDIAEILRASDKFLGAQRLVNYFQSIACGARAATVTVSTGDVQASGTLTLTSVVATDAVVINGVTLTAVASGATSAQFNVGASDTETAANLAATINASVNAALAGIVTASSNSTVVTVTAVEPGLTGNAITLVSNDATIVASAARLAGGEDGTEVTYYFGTGA